MGVKHNSVIKFHYINLALETFFPGDLEEISNRVGRPPWQGTEGGLSNGGQSPANSQKEAEASVPPSQGTASKHQPGQPRREPFPAECRTGAQASVASRGSLAHDPVKLRLDSQPAEL